MSRGGEGVKGGCEALARLNPSALLKSAMFAASLSALSARYGPSRPMTFASYAVVAGCVKESAPKHVSRLRSGLGSGHLR